MLVVSIYLEFELADKNVFIPQNRFRMTKGTILGSEDRAMD